MTPPDCYAHVGVMLETLHISELLPKFKAAMINVSEAVYICVSEGVNINDQC